MDDASWGTPEGEEVVPGRRAVRLLGGGRRYEAYLAWDEALYSLVVVKVLRPALADDPSTRAGLAGEVDVLGRLAHPVIVRSFAADLDGDRPYVVLEFLDGPRLSTLLRRYGVVVEQVLPLALQMCSALHYMAGAGVLHLDLKPRNVIMAGPPRLIDLSVARRADQVPDITSPIGTDAYMAPEQCDPARFGTIGPPADIWGLGATLYEALTARQAFPREDGGERFPQLTTRPAPFPDRRRVPPAVGEAVLSCLADDPAARPTAAELAETLEPLVEALPRPKLGMFRPGGRRR
ncbi:MAG: serine/threonine-protein kinase [Thermoleophilia bacterium]